MQRRVRCTVAHPFRHGHFAPCSTTMFCSSSPESQRRQRGACFILFRMAPRRETSRRFGRERRFLHQPFSSTCTRTSSWSKHFFVDFQKSFLWMVFLSWLARPKRKSPFEILRMFTFFMPRAYCRDKPPVSHPCRSKKSQNEF